jgi:hypothetical protein
MMGYSHNDSHVYGMLFTESGKWKYDVCLDYTGQTLEEYQHWDVNAEAVKALARATDRGISGVTLRTVPEGWSLVVPQPHALNSCPAMVRGGRARDEAEPDPTPLDFDANGCASC